MDKPKTADIIFASDERNNSPQTKARTMSKPQRIMVKDIPFRDLEVIKAIAKNGCRAGDTLSDLAHYTGISSQRLAAVARKYDGKRISRVIINYLPPQGGSMVAAAPGIKNPRTGICARIPAEISITTLKGKLKEQ